MAITFEPRTDEMTAERAAMIEKEMEKKSEERLAQRRLALEEAKRNGNKEEIDVFRVLNAYRLGADEERIRKLAEDPRVIEEVEMQYYLDAPKEVKTGGDFVRWLLEMSQ